MNDHPFVPSDDGADERVRFSVSLSAQDHEAIERIAKFWNDFAEAQGKPRSRKWKLNSALERLLRAQLDAFSHQIGADVRDTERSEEKLRKILAEVRKQSKK